MKTIVFLITALAMSLSACAQKSVEVNTSLPWLQIKIWDYQSKPVSNPPRSVIKTAFEGKLVYYVPAVCCDIPSELYAEDGKLICYPSGGFTGAGDGKCPMFRSEYLDNLDNLNNNSKKDKKTSLIWRDERKPAPSTKIIPDLQ